MTRRLCPKPPGSRPRDGHSCRNMFQRPYSPDKIYQVLSFYIPYQHILNYLRTITLAYIFLYRTSAHYKSDALLRTARASCSTPASVHHTDEPEHKPPPLQSGLHQQCRGRLSCLCWLITPRWILTGLTYQVKSIHYIFILYIAFFKRAITLACKFSNAGQIVHCKKGLLYH